MTSHIRKMEQFFAGIRAGAKGLADLKAYMERLGFGPAHQQRMIARNPIIREDPWSIVGVEKDDPNELIKQVCLLKVKWYHPDSTRKKGGDRRKFERLIAAFNQICDERGMKRG